MDVYFIHMKAKLLIRPDRNDGAGARTIDSNSRRERGVLEDMGLHVVLLSLR